MYQNMAKGNDFIHCFNSGIPIESGSSFIAFSRVNCVVTVVYGLSQVAANYMSNTQSTDLCCVPS